MIDNPSIFFGRIEDVNDPQRIGRVRVRIFGVHTQNTSLIPTEALPWSHVSTDVQDSGISGLGWSPTGVVKDAVVWGFYLDAEKLEPFVVGAYHGFDEATGTHDVNALARGVVTAMAANKAQFAESGVGVRATSSNDTGSEGATQSEGSSSPGTTSASGSADTALAAENDISAATAKALEMVKLNEAQIAALKAICGSDTQKYNFMCNVLSIENRGNESPKNAVSPAGAAGPFQMMPATAKALGVTGVGTSNDGRNDFKMSATAVSALYDEINKRWNGNRAAMYAGYNGGNKYGNAQAAGQPLQNKENNDYVKMAMYLEAKQGTPAKPTETPVDPATGETPDETYDPEKWMSIAQGEIGTKEYSGVTNNNPRILEYHAATSLNASNDETPWCSAFACWVMKKAGIQGTRSALARSWVNWGYGLKGPKYGAIVVVTRGNNPAQGHVGFVSKFDANTIWILGGNQKDSVSIVAFKRSSVLAYRWPGPADAQETADEAAANPTWTLPVGGPKAPSADAGGAIVSGGPYPWNRVHQSRSGHIHEIDDTPGNARLHQYHMSGTFREILNEGTITDKSVQDRYTVTAFNDYTLVGKNLSLTVNGTSYYRFKGDAVMHCDTTLFLEGGSRVQVNAPLVAFSELIAAPSASFKKLDVLAVIEGTCKNALWAAQAGSLGGSAQAVINQNINTAMEASVKAAQDLAVGKFTASFGPTPPSAATAREGDIWVPTGVNASQQGQQIFKNGEWVPDTTSSVRIVPTTADEDGKTVYFEPNGPDPVTVIVGPSEPILTEAQKAEQPLWINKLTGVVKEWAPVALKWAAVGITAKVYADDVKNVGGVAAGVVVTKAIDGYEKAVQALTALSQAASALDGQVNTFYQEAEPTKDQNPGIGDFWFNTSDGMKGYIYALGPGNVPFWKRDESDVAIILKNLSGLTTGKSTTYFELDDPTTNVSVKVVSGDIWFHPAELLVRRWDGNEWVLVKSSGDSISGGTIQGASLTTSANETEERLVIDSSTNSTVYYGTDDNGETVELARTGGTSTGTNSISKVGSPDSSYTALELSSAGIALDVKGTTSMTGPVLVDGVMSTTKPIKVGPHVIGSGTPPAAANFPFHMMVFRTSATTPVVTVCYSDGVNWRKVKDDSVFI